MKKYDVIVIGAGAAGMMCAIEAGKRGRSVLVVDHSKSIGEKIRISGGGRCNFTNLDINRENFISQNPYFAVSALSRFTQWDFIDLISRHGIAYHEKTLGQLFCDGSAKEIIAMLQREMQAAGVEVALNTSVKSIDRTDEYQVSLSSGMMVSRAVVVACGGKSIPKIGATGFGYQIAEKFGLSVVETRPALVPLTFAPSDLARIKPLAGTSVFASVGCNGQRFDEGFLFTHRGISGPSILQISSYWREGDEVSINLAPKVDGFGVLRAKRAENGRIAPKTALQDIVPKSLAGFIAEGLSLDRNLADQSDKSLRLIADALNDWRIKPVGSEGYRTAEVTLGGVNTDELDAKTMESRKNPGLYFIGEVVDVTGWLGGYNFQWAWSSGWAAGQVV
ncbi:hypothetical protein GCM10007939_24310 [Amylibacter marinus]|uniref:NAD(P)/FAD-dependent oxidoreductase n=1 Tax=Amylibacter marinus TaxID=1475483 RepID=A0ABQ5VXJ4_9RHOB|nr:NAD(P)/FAD-dependent oxidoreductase [Amylibacter marinus]GLQ36147.1 hypothetical protein GCM10007939_24310 [Amylibacter marinus]